MPSPLRLSTGALLQARIFLRAAAPNRHHHQHRALSQRFLSSSRPQASPLPRTRDSRRRYSSQQKPPKKDPNRVGLWPFVALVAVATGAWVMLVNKRQEMAVAAKTRLREENQQARTPTTTSTPTSTPTPRFNDSDVTVIFVLGGPGAGKGTQCGRLVDRYGFTHLSAGDLLRAEQARPGSEFGTLISDCIKDGTIVPMEVTIKLLENAMEDAMRGDAEAEAGSGPKKARFLIDGFPRKMDQALKFEETVCRARLVLFFDCPEEAMEARLLERGKTSGRSDDNAESIRKRFRTFVETSMPVVDFYERAGRVMRVDAGAPPDAVFKDTAGKLAERLGGDFK